MRWRGRRQSENIEDRRSQSSGFGTTRSPVGQLLPLLLSGRLGKTGIVLALGFIIWQFVSSSFHAVTTSQSDSTRSHDDMKAMVATVLAETEDVWKKIFAENNLSYREPTLVLFRGMVSSACGTTSSAVGPFYCPYDQKVYLDLSFFQELKNNLGASGDFAQAYVIAHEVGHHVQTLLGISEKTQRLRRQLSEVEGNKLSVRQELQADCFAGLWAKGAESTGLLEEGDIVEALNAAAAIGDDTLQRRQSGYVRPDAFTHGSSKQRVHWLETGMSAKSLKDCDTFRTSSL